MKPASKFVFKFYLFKKRVAQLCDWSGGSSIPDHDLMGNKMINVSENERGWASILDHPFGGNLKIF